MRFWCQGVPSVKGTLSKGREINDTEAYRAEVEARVRAERKRSDEEAARLRLAQKGIKLGRH